MTPIIYYDRETGKKLEEKVYGQTALKLLYGKSLLCRILEKPLHLLISKTAFVSYLFGLWNKLPITKSRILPFIQKYQIDTTEFLDPVESFSCFNDFFIRKLKPEARPITEGKNQAIIPADGRYLFFQNIQTSDGFAVKGQKFTLSSLLQDASLAKKYENGAMMIARLCPTDYHRYHFPVDCQAGKSTLINGAYFSVNPIAIKRDIDIFTKNKRTVSVLESEVFGKLLFLEVGATNVGSINQTYRAESLYKKGDEKGYFAFGASSLIILFEKDKIAFDKDLIKASEEKIEIRCLMGQSMGHKK